MSAPRAASRGGAHRGGGSSRAGALPSRLDRRNALFQQWTALLGNRTKRSRAGEMIIQGVRPLTLALESGVTLRALLSDGRERPSRWAAEILADPPAPVVVVAPELLAELGERSDGAPELLAVAAIPEADWSAIPASPERPLVVFDRPTSPGNIGSLVRTIDALGGAGLVLTGHSADPWDPAAVRASTGSIFSVPVLTQPSAGHMLERIAARRDQGEDWLVVGLDEAGEAPLEAIPAQRPVLLVVGNETVGLSAGWKESCDLLAAIPMSGRASSLNASVAGSIALYALGQRIRV